MLKTVSLKTENNVVIHRRNHIIEKTLQQKNAHKKNRSIWPVNISYNSPLSFEWAKHTAERSKSGIHCRPGRKGAKYRG